MPKAESPPLAARTVRTHAKRYLNDCVPYSSTYTNPWALWWEKWYVRVISVAIVLLITALYIVIYPVILVITLIIDVVRYSKIGGFNVTRSFLFFLAYLFIELAAFVMFTSLYFWKLATNPSREKWMRANYKAQTIWGKYMVFEMIRKVLGIKLHVEFSPALTPGPKILFMRHVSFADTLIPQGTLSDKFGLRYILKRDLLWDPALNIAGSRTPQFFLFREAGGQGAMDVEIKGMSNLVSTLTPQTQAVVAIWPEGTRFTPGKRKKILESLQKKDADAYERAKQLNNTLLPRVAGALALLEVNKCADVFFCAHVGLEGAADFFEMVSGNMCNRTLRVRFECVKYADIPKTREARTEWIYDHWKAIDTWIGERQAENSKKDKKKL
eukprot:Phypoly_transcript_10268.p1 GENE.Phypoly_transcript_10268~~Phypoly_transcript_10268.p1  ORF type:complete len:384 (+),score=79.55 Phypoly_transcript_10268:170-1321(+)